MENSLMDSPITSTPIASTSDQDILKTGIREQDMPKLTTARNVMPRVAVFRKEHFNAAHRLHNPNWSNEKNTRVYGKCNNPNYHGHNYDLIVQVTGPIDPETGYVIDMKYLGDVMKKHVIDRFDHKNLNLDTEEFADLNPSAENIAIVIYTLLRNQLSESLDLKIRLYETERNFVEYPVA